MSSAGHVPKISEVWVIYVPPTRRYRERFAGSIFCPIDSEFVDPIFFAAGATGLGGIVSFACRECGRDIQGRVISHNHGAKTLSAATLVGTGTGTAALFVCECGVLTCGSCASVRPFLHTTEAEVCTYVIEKVTII